MYSVSVVSMSLHNVVHTFVPFLHKIAWIQIRINGILNKIDNYDKTFMGVDTRRKVEFISEIVLTNSMSLIEGCHRRGKVSGAMGLPAAQVRVK